jgi:hypothetical protein
MADVPDHVVLERDDLMTESEPAEEARLQQLASIGGFIKKS